MAALAQRAWRKRARYSSSSPASCAIHAASSSSCSMSRRRSALVTGLATSWAIGSSARTARVVWSTRCLASFRCAVASRSSRASESERHSCSGQSRGLSSDTCSLRSVLADDLDTTHDACVELVEFLSGHPKLPVPVSADLLRLIARCALPPYVEAGHVADVARRGVFGVPVTSNLVCIPLVENGVEDGLAGQAGREPGEAGGGDEVELLLSDGPVQGQRARKLLGQRQPHLRREAPLNRP